MATGRGASLSLAAMESLSENASSYYLVMKIRITTVVACCLVISCSFQKKEEGSSTQNYYLVEKLNENFDEDATSAPPTGYYAKHNILLLDSTKEMFYHDHYFSCGTGFSPNAPPRRIDLTGGRIQRVDSIEILLKKIIETESTPRLVIIGSDVDTIRGPKYFGLVQALRKIDKCYLLNTRKITEDERLGILSERQ